MKVHTKRGLAVHFLILSILMIIPNSAPAAESKDRIAINIPRLWLLAGLFFSIPMYQVISKTSKPEIPPEEEYSWQEMKKSVEILWNNFFSNNVKKLLRREKKGYSKEQVEEAAKILWKNIKNLYNMGFVGQKKRNRLATVIKGKYLECSERAPVRGILGHFINMLDNIEKVSFKMIYLIGAYYFIRFVAKDGLNISMNFSNEVKRPIISIF